MHDPGDIVKRFAEDGIPRVRRFENDLECVVGGQAESDPDHVGPRDHHVDRFLLGKVEDLVEHLLLGGLDLPRVLGGCDRLTNVLPGESDHPGRGRLHPEHA